MRHFHVVAGLVGARPEYRSDPMLTRREAQADLADHVEAAAMLLDDDTADHLFGKLEDNPDYLEFDVSGVENWDYIEVRECHETACVERLFASDNSFTPRHVTYNS